MNRLIVTAGALLSLTLATGASAQTAGDPDAGKSVFRKCMACHAVGEGAKNKIGPELNGIIGAKPGVVEGYNYSPAFAEWSTDKAAWNAELMTAWLTDPRAVVKGTKMVFPGIKKEKEMVDVLAYLASFDESGATRDPAEALAAAAAQ
ncbi:cytochrome c family protein [Aurantimonas sp. A2-1-M11]|uniref:c-type cytochrome n=1 Tax=Aurantimonas sp. A2-1-M11 TaxID=3113712 RepID=UPI002F9378CB